MPTADPSFAWPQALAWFFGVAAAAFLVTWLVTDRGRVSRTPYIAVLTLVSLGLAASYVLASGTSVADLLTSNVLRAVMAGLVATALVLPLVRRLPTRPHATGARLLEEFGWEDVVYGVAEGVLLAALPVLTLWHAATDLGWTDAGVSRIVSGALALGGSLLVVLVHHLGYAEFRRREARRMLAGALVTCDLQAFAFLVTGSMLAPIVAHITLHLLMTMKNVELPPTTAMERSPTVSAA
jgi:hypothetical protein